MSFFKNLRAKILLASLIPATLALLAVALIALIVYEGVARDIVQQRDTELAKISAARLSAGLSRHSGILQTAFRRWGSDMRWTPSVGQVWGNVK